ncbi:beta-glucosidase [Caballeronia sp. LZ065]|uniref:beta-glucosidase n=1 Tax=Caballeronia sp. LZ065 TaxID=3038571 RepID=UPI00285FE6F4|nr:beta-glucosidase [Caballeronia sp. LZ065]MDR5784413.1 beta-glucosidase [Caballeronia sp. LZ065]
MLSSTGHDVHALADYASLIEHGIVTVRDGVRWHLIESRPGRYDWTSVLPMLRAAHATGVQVIWDLCHYGWPDHVDIWRPQFVEAFAKFAAATAAVIASETEDSPIFTLINEISFWSWFGGEVGDIRPSTFGRGLELKHQLVRATIAATDAIRSVSPGARFITTDPLINVVSRLPERRDDAERQRLSQYQAFDMLTGELWPGLGGAPSYLDIVGLNYYSFNQWLIEGGELEPADPMYRPLPEMLKEVHRRYGRPLVIAETGAEGHSRQPWLSFVSDEVYQARTAGVPVQGVCLYPILDYPGWANDRHCETGLFGYANASAPGEESIGPLRPLFRPLADEIALQRLRFEEPSVSHIPSASDALTRCASGPQIELVLFPRST